jgi:hypothetical protein
MKINSRDDWRARAVRWSWILPFAIALFSAWYFIEGDSAGSWIARIIIFSLMLGYPVWMQRRWRKRGNADRG